MDYGVVTVTLNCAETVARTIESVTNQTVPPSQYVFVDGGSDDGTVETISSSIEEARRRGLKTRFRVLHQHGSGGITEAWNMGIEALDVQVVSLLNGDDWFDSDAAEEMLACFGSHPSTDIVLGNGRYFSPDAPAPKLCRPRSPYLLPFAMTVVHPACFVRRSVYERVGLFEEKYRVTADYEFIYRCRKAGINFRKGPNVWVNVQVGGFAEQNRPLARRETAEIGVRYSRMPALPRIAFLLRTVLGR